MDRTVYKYILAERTINKLHIHSNELTLFRSIRYIFNKMSCGFVQMSHITTQSGRMCKQVIVDTFLWHVVTEEQIWSLVCRHETVCYVTGGKWWNIMYIHG